MLATEMAPAEATAQVPELSLVMHCRRKHQRRARLTAEFQGERWLANQGAGSWELSPGHIFPLVLRTSPLTVTLIYFAALTLIIRPTSIRPWCFKMLIWQAHLCASGCQRTDAAMCERKWLAELPRSRLFLVLSATSIAIAVVSLAFGSWWVVDVGCRPCRVELDNSSWRRCALQAMEWVGLMHVSQGDTSGRAGRLLAFEDCKVHY